MMIKILMIDVLRITMKNPVLLQILKKTMKLLCYMGLKFILKNEESKSRFTNDSMVNSAMRRKPYIAY